MKKYIRQFATFLKRKFKNSRLAKGSFVQAGVFFLKSWWHFILLGLAFVVCLYYPLGAFFIHHIDRNPNYEIVPVHEKRLASIDTLAMLIDREVNVHLWTANLPFFFPSYFLDNMPNFQLGLMKANEVVALNLSKQMNATESSELSEAADLLTYPGDIWLFRSDSNLIPAPSSARQYRKARQHLLTYNEQLENEIVSFVPSEISLAPVLEAVAKSLEVSDAQLEVQIREYSGDFWDGKADDVFFYNQGKAYGYLILLRAIGNDYRKIIVENEVYEKWTRLLSALEQAVAIQPVIIRNADLSDVMASNHLSYLAFYILKARSLIVDIVRHFEVR